MAGPGKKSLFFILITTIFVFAFVMFLNVKAYMRINENKQEIARLQAEYEAEVARTGEIEELYKYMQTDEYKVGVAQRQLGLVNDNQIVFKEYPENK